MTFYYVIYIFFNVFVYLYVAHINLWLYIYIIYMQEIKNKVW